VSRPWRWLALVEGAAAGAEAAAAVRTADGGPAGHLAVWAAGDGRRPPGALRVDRRAVESGGDPGWVSLALAAAGGAVPFDDPAVSGALRRRLALPWPRLCSTLLVDWSRLGGALTGGATPAEVEEDPFALVFPRRLLAVDGGLLGRMPAPTGPGITRYGSGNPWPWDVYTGQVR
jgi:hypothetical protein